MTRDINKLLQFRDAYIEKGYLYFSALNFNGLFRVKVGEEDAEFLGHFEQEELWQKDMHCRCIRVRDELYFIPVNGKGISIYNFMTGKQTFVEVSNQVKRLFANAHAVGETILLIPFSTDVPFMVLDTISKTIDAQNHICSMLQDEAGVGDTMLFDLHSTVVFENSLFAVIFNTNIVMQIDLKNLHIVLHRLLTTCALRNIYMEKGKCYMTTLNNLAVVVWNYYTGECIDCLLKGEDKTFSYIAITRYNDRLLLLPDRAEHILELKDGQSEWKINEKIIPSSFFRIKKKNSLFLGHIFYGEELLLLPRAGNGLIRISEKGSVLNNIACNDIVAQKAVNIKLSYAKKFESDENIIYEKKQKICLQDLILVVKNLV